MSHNKGSKVSRSKQKSSREQDPNIWTTVRSNAGIFTLNILKAYCLVNLTLFASEVLRSSLDPVYGSISAAKYHGPVTLLALLVSCSTYTFWRGPRQAWANSLAVIGLAVPTVQTCLFRYSGRLGPSVGPLLTSLVTSFPLVLVAGVAAAKELAETVEKILFPDGPTQKRFPGRAIAQALNAGVCLTAYFEPKIGSLRLAGWLRTQIVHSRVGLYYLLAMLYTLRCPAAYLMCFIILLPTPILQASLISSYVPFSYSDAKLNATLQRQGFSLVARQESVTGYISILDNVKDGFRVMRCDHSLLGGEWIPQPGQVVTGLQEPIYAVFVMLEAVRLVVPEGSANHHQGQAARGKNALVM